MCNLIHHAIDTGENAPILCQAYREPHRLKPIIREIITDMLKNNLIRPSKSPWAFPVVIVPKPDGKWRFTVDYRKLNNIVPRDAFPLPLVADHLASLGEAKWFTVLDLVSGYWQIPVREEDIEKTAFICSEGLYEYQRMPMGLSNSPATFQRLMQKIIPAHIRNSHALVYLDDIIIYSATIEEHLEHIDNILGLLAGANLKVKPKKVSFAKNEVNDPNSLKSSYMDWPFKDYDFYGDRYVNIEDSTATLEERMWYDRENIFDGKTPTECIICIEAENEMYTKYAHPKAHLEACQRAAVDAEVLAIKEKVTDEYIDYYTFYSFSYLLLFNKYIIYYDIDSTNLPSLVLVCMNFHLIFIIWI
jgi:hypothetical protein